MVSFSPNATVKCRRRSGVSFEKEFWTSTEIDAEEVQTGYSPDTKKKKF